MTWPVYLDHHATTPLCHEARVAMIAWIQGEAVGNPSSVHRAGRRARAHLEDARAALSEAIDATPREVVFTSGGTEAVHLAVQGVGDAMPATEVWCDPGAHPCLRAACEALAARRAVPFGWIPCGRDGALMAPALREGALVAASLVQHETGAVLDTEVLREAVDRAGASLVLDAAQALGRVPLAAPVLGAVAVTFSGHKIGAPPGVGALYLRGDVRCVPRTGGGGQERGLRAGTENILGVVGLGAAARALSTRLAQMADVAARRDVLEALLVDWGATVNGSSRRRVPTACHVSWPGLAAQELVAALDLEGVCVSSGAACSSGRAEPSESLRRIYPDEPWRAEGALRVTLGPETTDVELQRFAAALARVLPRFGVRPR